MKRILILAVAICLGVLNSNVKAEQLTQTLAHPWAGKRIAYIGDSVSDPNVRTGQDMKHYWKCLEEWLGTKTINYSVSGFTLANGLNSVDKLYKEHGQEVDAILVFLGTNDYNGGVPMGQAYQEEEVEVEVATGKPRHMEKRIKRTPDMNANTVKGRLNLLISKLKGLYPTKQIVMCTPLHRGYAEFGNSNVQPDERYQNAAGYYIDDVAEAIRQAGRIWSVPVIDLYAQSGLTPLVDEYAQFFFNKDRDRLHPNGMGHERIARLIMQQTLALPVFSKQATKNVLEEGPQWVRLRNYKEIEKGSALDFSGQKLQEAPAGKYGWLKAKEGRFEFEKRPGREQRFYGINLCFTANYPTHEVADLLTERLVRLGYNSIRVHHHDDIWAHADAEMRDRLDYLLAKAIEKGLYVTTDMYVSRRVLWTELGVEREGYVGMDLFKTLVGCYEPAFKNWCDFSREFMEHTNPYTGRMYKDEPGMPLISLVNEGELFMGFDSKAEEPIVQQAYREFIGRDEKLEAWKGGFNDFQDYLEKRIAERCSAFLREMGCKALLTNDNNGFKHGEGESATSLYDYVDNHFYIDHPQFLERSWSLPSRCDNRNPVTYGGPEMFRKNYAKGFSKPYTISEWNFSGPGRYRGLGGILTGAKAAIQEWDGLWRFAYSHSAESLVDDEGHYPGYFDVSTDPLSQASDRASICLFLRRDATREEELELNQESGVLKLATGRTCGIFATEGKYSAGLLTAEISGAPGTVCLSSLDGKDLEKSRHMLLSHITDVQGAGTEYADAERKVLLKWGYGTLIERGRAEIAIAVAKPSKYKVYELDTAGRRIRTIPCRYSDEGIFFTVSTDNEQGEGRIYYEIGY